ncbi:hypothetical protein [Nonomuraea sp. 10N515B]|uniref:hypothetical protein n=1 Tax=Nonomuraea sp. 10N515B TaxID=3457422 RepID=UPI003FCCC48F
MTDPRQIQTRASLCQALQELFESVDSGYLAVATKAKIAPATLHAMVTGASFPRWVTLKSVLIALGVPQEELAAWQTAHQRAAGDKPAAGPGWPLAEVTDPFRFDLEVHHAIDTGDADLSALPVYVPREHDRMLAQVVARGAAGDSRIAVLVGGSSTGKTRACWEALHLLRAQPEPWRLWHPIDPTRPEAALACLTKLSPYTVVWLNEAQFYLADSALGESVAAALRELLRDARRAPVLVLATLWPKYWDSLTSRADPDLHAQARELLDGHNLPVPDAFTGTDLEALVNQKDSDPRLGEASERAQDGRITQYLAGVPVLMDRYHQAAPPIRALIHAAMDARRLGRGPRLPLALLADAAPGYLTNTEWDQTDEHWLTHALNYVTQPCNGIPGILTPAKPDTARNRRTSANAAAPPQAGIGPMYRLADYLDQHARRARADQIPPIDFWTAAARHAQPGDFKALGDAARARGLYRDAAQLWKHATSCYGDPHAAAALVEHMHELNPNDHHPAYWAAAHTSLDDLLAEFELVVQLRTVGADEAVRMLLARDPVHTTVDDLTAAATLVRRMRTMGMDAKATQLADGAAAHAPLDNPAVMPMLQEIAGHKQITTLLIGSPAAPTALDPADVVSQLDTLRMIGADEQARVLADRAAAYIPLDNPADVVRLLDRLRHIGADEQIVALTNRFPAAGLFWLWLRDGDRQRRFAFGREPDGSPAAPWTWDDLE